MQKSELEKELLDLADLFTRNTDGQGFNRIFLPKLSDLRAQIKEDYPQIAAALQTLYSECNLQSTMTTFLVINLLAEKVHAAESLDISAGAISHIRHVKIPGIQNHPQIQHCYALIETNRPLL